MNALHKPERTERNQHCDEEGNGKSPQYNFQGYEKALRNKFVFELLHFKIYIFVLV